MPIIFIYVFQKSRPIVLYIYIIGTLLFGSRKVNNKI